MLLAEIMAMYSNIHLKITNTLYGINGSLFKATTGRTYSQPSSYCASSGKEQHSENCDNFESLS
jgi:hypothetical protein